MVARQSAQDYIAIKWTVFTFISDSVNCKCVVCHHYRNTFIITGDISSVTTNNGVSIIYNYKTLLFFFAWLKFQW